MKRRLARICVFLVLGAIVNVAVAWGFGCMSVPDGNIHLLNDAVYVYSHAAADDPSRVRRTIGANPVDPSKVKAADSVHLCSISEIKGIGVRSFQLGGNPLGPSASASSLDGDSHWMTGLEWEAHAPNGLVGNLCGQGWPLIALWYGQFESDKLDGGWLLSREQGPGSLYYNRALAFRPIWPGFAINALFYGAMLWLMFAAASAIRRWRRIHRGLCPKCAYPIGMSEVCTECGTRLPRH